jgi:GT2 family glycosyltransferase
VYCDDDTELSPNTLIKVREIFAAQPEVVGLTGNLDQTVKHNFFKRLFGRLSLTYTKQPYGFTTGIFNIINSVTQPTKVDWLPGAFMCYRWSVVQDIIFDEWFTEYGLGEDFDFSYRVGTLGILLADPSIVVAHHHSQVNRNWKKFGYMRLVNRNYLRVKLWPKQGLYWLGMWWSNMWLLAMPYRPEWIGEMQGLLTILLKRAIFPRYENNLYRTKGYPSTGRRR